MNAPRDIPAPPAVMDRRGEKCAPYPTNACQQLVAGKVMNAPRGIPAPPPNFPPAYSKKRALLIGITYRWSRRQLEAPLNDVNCMRFLLQQKFGFPPESILVLTDHEADPSRMATRENMVAAMRWLVQGCQSGDSLVFYFSGHGSQQRDKDGDELDRYDETLLPMDYEKNGVIVDDEVHATIVRPLPHGVKLHAVVDACHSGSALDLPFVCNMNSNGYYQWKKYSRVDKQTSGGLAICFSSCNDNKKSFETMAYPGRTMVSVMTYCFIEAVKSGTGITYDRILQNMHRATRETRVGMFRLSQVTQLSSSKKFDLKGETFFL